MVSKGKKKYSNYKNNEVRRSLSLFFFFVYICGVSILMALLHSAPSNRVCPLVLIQWKQIHGTLASNTEHIPSVRRTNQDEEEK